MIDSYKIIEHLKDELSKSRREALNHRLFWLDKEKALEQRLVAIIGQRDAAIALMQEYDPTADDDNGWAQRYLGLLHEIEEESK